MLQAGDISLLTPEVIYKGNNCIDIPDSYTSPLTLVMPLNNVQDIENKPNVMMFFDKVSSESSFDLYCILSVQNTSGEFFKTYYFTKTKNWDYNSQIPNSSPWRFELKYPLGTLPALQNNGKVTVKITGSFAVDSVELRGELYDEVKISEGDDGYHPKSRIGVGATNVIVPVEGYSLTSNSDSFIFDQIEIDELPDGMEHNYIFQCIAPYDDLIPVFMIGNFNLEYTPQ